MGCTPVKINQSLHGHNNTFHEILIVQTVLLKGDHFFLLQGLQEANLLLLTVFLPALIPVGQSKLREKKMKQLPFLERILEDLNPQQGKFFFGFLIMIEYCRSLGTSASLSTLHRRSKSPGKSVTSISDKKNRKSMSNLSDKYEDGTGPLASYTTFNKLRQEKSQAVSNMIAREVKIHDAHIHNITYLYRNDADTLYTKRVSATSSTNKQESQNSTRFHQQQLGISSRVGVSDSYNTEASNNSSIFTRKYSSSSAQARNNMSINNGNQSYSQSYPIGVGRTLSGAYKDSIDAGYSADRLNRKHSHQKHDSSVKISLGSLK